MKSGFQTTIRHPVTLDGIGVHSGKPVSITIQPAEPGNGITFLRTGLEGGREREIVARHDEVTDTRLCTVLGDARRGSVSTVEHLMAALRGLGIDNVVVEIDGPETPIMDGSARAFVEAIDRAGIVASRVRRRVIRVLKTVRVEMGRAWAELVPNHHGFSLDIEIDFANPLIGRQRTALDLNPDSFRREIAGARTFGFMHEVEQLWRMNLALGSSLENSVALTEDRVLNPEGPRWPDEFARHKALDAVGDLALAGAPLLATYRSYCGGHRLNAMMVEALFAHADAWTYADAPQRQPARGHAQGHAEHGLRLAAAYAPETN